MNGGIGRVRAKGCVERGLVNRHNRGSQVGLKKPNHCDSWGTMIWSTVDAT